MKKFYSLFLTIALIQISLCLSGQANCDTGRYYDAVFEEIQVTSDIVFGEAEQDGLGGVTNIETLELDVYEPVGDDTENRPLIILAFGGAFVTGSKLSPDIIELCTRFAHLGYVAVAVEYRITQAIITDPSEATVTRAVLKAVHDMKAAVRFFRKDAEGENLYKIDTDKIYMGGVSAGAVAAVHYAYLDTQEEVPDVLMPMYDELGGLEGLSGNPGYSSSVSGIINLCGAIKDTTWMVENDLPIVSMHGTADAVVPYGAGLLTLLEINMELDGSQPIHEKAMALGLKSEFYTFQGADHTPFIIGGTPTDQASYMDTTFAFVRDFLFTEVCEGVALGTADLVDENVKVIALLNQAVNLTLSFIVEGEGLKRNPNFSIFSNNGQLVKSGKVANDLDRIDLNVSDLSSGLYFLKVGTAKAVKFIKR